MYINWLLPRRHCLSLLPRRHCLSLLPRRHYLSPLPRPCWLSAGNCLPIKSWLCTRSLQGESSVHHSQGKARTGVGSHWTSLIETCNLAHSALTACPPPLSQLGAQTVVNLLLCLPRFALLLLGSCYGIRCTDVVQDHLPEQESTQG